MAYTDLHAGTVHCLHHRIAGATRHPGIAHLCMDPHARILSETLIAAGLAALVVALAEEQMHDPPEHSPDSLDAVEPN